MSLSEILKAIDKLPVEESKKIYSYLGNKLNKKERVLDSLNEIRGIGKGLWELDAQEFVKSERASDRF
jgi:hypothetical protein